MRALRACVRSCVRACVRAYVRACVRACVREQDHSRMHKYTRCPMQAKGRTEESLTEIAARLKTKKFELDVPMMLKLEAEVCV